MESSYTAAAALSLRDTATLEASLPLSFPRQTVTLKSSRSAGGKSIAEENGSYITDSRQMLEAHSGRTWMYNQIPVYEMFDRALSEKISADYSAQYEIDLSRKLQNSLADIFIPSSVQTAMRRDIKNQDSAGDLYQFKAVITNMSMNNFGQESHFHPFKWFRQEEIISNITGIVKIPADSPENTTFQITSYIQTLIFIDDSAYLTGAVDASFETDTSWQTRGTFIYTRPGKTSLSKAVMGLILPGIMAQKTEIKRKDALNVEFGGNRESHALRQKYELSHSADLTFLQYFTITTGAGFSFTTTQTDEVTANVMALTLTLGAKAVF